MISNFEETYNEALEMLKQGHSQEEVLLKFAEFSNFAKASSDKKDKKDELAPLLSLSAALLDMPKNIVPTPLMKRKYAVARAKSLWLAWIHVPKFAGLSIGFMLLLSAFTVMGYQTLNSSPGQIFFPVKKSVESLRLTLAFGQDAKANLQIEIAQKRLSEAREIFSNPNSGVEQKKAALTELTDQTSNAVAQVNTAAKNNPASAKNHPLLNSLDTIAHDQQNLLAEIKPDKQITTETGEALHSLNENSAKISQIKQSVAAADTDQALAKLSADPNSVAILGNISKISPSQITVEKTTFEINFQTLIRDSLGNGLAVSQLNSKAKVNVVGVKILDSIFARQIILIRPDIQPQVKGAETAASSTLDNSKTQTTTPTTATKKIQENKTDTDTTTNSALGSFILEDPAPQFAQ